MTVLEQMVRHRVATVTLSGRSSWPLTTTSAATASGVDWGRKGGSWGKEGEFWKK